MAAEPTVPATATVPAVVLLTVAAPDELKLIVPAAVDSGPIVPVPALRLTVPPLTVPVEPIVPVPFAVNVTAVVPLTLD
jgi:hypothetical protein